MFFVNVLLVMYFVSNAVIDNVYSRLSITLALKEEYNLNSEDVKSLIYTVENIEESIVVDYKSKDEALETLLKDKNEDFWEILEWENPLPNTITISNVGPNSYEAVNEKVESKMYVLDEDGTESAWDKNTTYRNQYQKIQKLTLTIKTLQSWLYAMILVFIVSIFIIIYSVISNFVYYYRDEIHITKLVGWDTKFIYGPFSIQGALYSLFALLFSFSLFAFFYNNVGYLFSSVYFSLDTFIWFDFLQIFFWELIVFTFLWLLSGYYSSKKYF